MINFIDNIAFQKDNFPAIFSSYMFPGNEKKKYVFQAKELDYLYFLVNDGCSLITHINECFGVNLIFDLPASAAIISFGYENRLVDFDEGIVKVSVNHPYLEINHAVVFSHIVINTLLEKSYEFYSFVDKPLKQMTELQIRKFCQDYHFDTHNLPTYEKVLDIIACNRPLYIFSQDKVYNNPQRMYLKDVEHGDMYSLLIIPIINDSLMLKENEIIQNCVNGVMCNFLIRCKAILEKHLQPGEFDVNYIIIEKYFQFEKKCKQELSSYFKDTLLSSIRDYKRIRNDHTTLHNLISNDGNILSIDNYMNEKVDEINNILEAI